MRALGFSFIIAVIFTSCASEEPEPIPKNVIAQDSMVHVLAELQIINAKSQHREIRKKKLSDFVKLEQQHLFDSLQISRTRFDSSMNFYLKDYDRMQHMHDEAMNLLSSRLAELNAVEDEKEKMKISEEGGN